MDITKFNTTILENVSDDTIKKVIKDFKLPFSFVNREYFYGMISHMVEVAPEFNPAVEVLTTIATTVGKEREPYLFGAVRRTVDAMVEYITHSTGYSAFNGQVPGMDINTIFPLENMNIPSGDNYNNTNIGKTFISIDLSNAAFQAMKLWDAIVGDANPDGDSYILGPDIKIYKDFITKCVDIVYKNAAEDVNNPENDFIFFIDKDSVINYLAHCKSVRQVIFGKTNPKRIMHIEKFIMQSLIKVIKGTYGFLPVRLNNDEIVYEYDCENNSYRLFDSSLSSSQVLTSMFFSRYNPSTGMNETIEVPMDFHKNLYVLRGYSLIQHDNYIPIEQKQRIRFFVKDNKTFAIHMPMGPEFKSLPSTVYLIARALYQSRPDIARFFESQPILVEGTFHWLALPGSDTNTWELMGTDNQ